jgi:NADH kinase
MILRRAPRVSVWRRGFSSTAKRREILDVEALEHRIIPRYQGKYPFLRAGSPLTWEETPNSDLLSLQWPSPLRNILMIKKDGEPTVTASLIEYAKSVCHPVCRLR